MENSLAYGSSPSLISNSDSDSDSDSVIYRSFLSAVSEADSCEERSFLSPDFEEHEKRTYNLPSQFSNLASYSSTQASDFSFSDLSTSNPSSFTIQNLPPTQIFKIRNLDTGEEIDLRDENKDSFVDKYAKLLKVKQNKASDLKEFYRLKRRVNEKLWQACREGNACEVRNLLDKTVQDQFSAFSNAKGPNEWSALHIAAFSGHMNICKILLYEEDSADIEAQTDTKQTPLHLACMKGHAEIVEFLLNSGAGIDACDSDFNSGLHYAAMYNHTSCINILLSYSPNIQIKNRRGSTAYDLSTSLINRDRLSEYANSTGEAIQTASYSRTPYQSVLLRNSRSDMVKKLLSISAPSHTVLNHLVSPNPFKYQPSPVLSLNPKDILGVSQLGKGTFGKVYCIRHKENGGLYALKVLDKTKIIERDILNSLDSPFIVKLHSSFQTADKLVLMMDYCSGGNLENHIVNEGQFTEEDALFYISELVLALEEIHKHDIAFRDLKPENVVLDSEGHVKLTDFGLAKKEMRKGQITRSFCGSLAYMAPEVLNRKGHDKSVDWYCLGAVLYEMVTGAPPYFASTREEIRENILKSTLILPDSLSTNCRDLLQRVIFTQLLQKDPSKRLGFTLGASEIKQHSFFSSINWTSVLSKDRKSPLRPSLQKSHRLISTEEMFGSNERHSNTQVIPDWSFIHTHRIKQCRV